MPKIVQFNLPGGGTVVQVPDNTSVALDIESTDAKDYIVVDTTDGAEKLKLGNSSTDVVSLGPVHASDGSVSAPGISFADDPDTGIFRIESGSTGFVQNGNTKMQLGAGGDLMIASGGGGAQARLHVVGATAGVIVRAAVDHADSYMLELRSSGNTEQVTFKETGEIEIYNGTAPGSSVTNGVQLYSEDVNQNPGSGAADYAELKVRDEIGNVTTLSPHNFTVAERSDPMAWAYYSKNAFVGKEINVDMMQVIKAVEQLSGQSFIHERNLDPDECRDWETEEQARVAKSEAAIEAYNALSDDEKTHAKVPQLYVAQPKPDWMS